jgi:hypothetical protein
VPPLYLSDKFTDIHQFINYLEQIGDVDNAEKQRKILSLEPGFEEEVDEDEQREA